MDITDIFTKLSLKPEHDQFYTKDNIAKECFDSLCDIVDISTFDVFFEPSAGKGAFFKLFDMNKRVGIDIEPKFEGIQELNLFDFTPNTNKKYITIGNPPFGKGASLAIKFFNTCSQFSEIIAFIIPRTFKRVSVQNQLNLSFELIYNKDLPLKPCCFEPTLNAKCCFQVWRKTESLRKKIIIEHSTDDFQFLKLGPKDLNNQPTPPDNADFVVKAYGSNCGEIVDTNLSSLRPKSWHWIKSNIEIELLKSRIKKIDFSISHDTVRQCSIGQKEFVMLYVNFCNTL